MVRPSSTLRAAVHGHSLPGGWLLTRRGLPSKPTDRDRGHLACRAGGIDAKCCVPNRAIAMVHYSGTRRSRSAFAMTETELNVIAALASIGLRNG